jgi:hypothetical protein
MRRAFVFLPVALASLAASALASQPSAAPVAAPPAPPSVAGSWRGAVVISPGEREIDVRVELKSAAGGWQGEMSVPSQDVWHKPLEAVVVDGANVSWIYKDSDGVSQEMGAVSPDGKSITGEHREQGKTYQLQLARVDPAVGDPRVTDLATLDDLKGIFNGDRGTTRLILILAPSCGLCQDGAGMVERRVLERLRDRKVAVYVLWVPISKLDTRALADRAAALLTDSRGRHFWTGDQQIAQAFAKPLGLARGPAWDVYLVYGPDALWTDGVPAPAAYMHRLGNDLPRERRFNALKLADEVAGIARR